MGTGIREAPSSPALAGQHHHEGLRRRSQPEGAGIVGAEF